MKDSLRILCDQFAANRQTVKSVFKMENSAIYPVCANLFCARGRTADADALVRAREVIKAHTGVFSGFRGNIRPALASLLAMSDRPEELMTRAVENYGQLKENFFGSEFLAMTAFLLADMGRDAADASAPGKALYRRMREEHPLLTGSEDSGFAVFLAMSGREEDALVSDMEQIYRQLRTRFRSGDSMQTVSHVLTLSPGDPEVKTQRLFDLYDAIGRAGGKYGKYYHMGTLAALSMLDADPDTLAADIMDVNAALEGQKGYGFFGLDRRDRLMHAAMIVSDEYTPRDTVDQAALTGTLSMILAQQMAVCAACAAAAASSASSSSAN